MKRLTLFIGVFLLFTSMMFAQKTITGKVTGKTDGLPLPGVTVSVKGTTIGTITDIEGAYKLTVPATATTLTFSFIGMTAFQVEIGTQTVINVTLEANATQLEGMVVTALGITREKTSLGYSTQEVKGELVNTVKSENFMNSLSGKVSGVQIKKTTNMGGSTNVLLRGSKSLTGDNQVLFVIDGVPVNNNITNTRDQQQGGIGYDYGNAASDINPDDIESINVLKGSAATALYGSRAAGGVVMITTKKGTAKTTGVGADSKSSIGVTINSGITMGFVDKSTFPKYQLDFGAGYGKYYGDDGDAYFNTDGTGNLWAPTTEDASYGAPFDPNLMVFQWDAVDPESPNYNKATPWVAAKNGPITFFEKPVTYTNSVSIDNVFGTGSYRLSYTNFIENGLLPNSKLNKDNLLMNGTWKVNDKLTATGSANYSTTKGLGRNSTGYSDNITGSFRQWMQTNVDIQAQKEAYFDTKRNMTWNWADPFDETQGPIYWDNYYWTRYENYENDKRNRFIGNVSLNYKVNSWLDIFGRVSGDSYNELQEERRAVGSIATPFGIGEGADGSINQDDQSSGYLRRDISFSEYNYDLMANFNKDLNKDFNLKGILGTNIRRTTYTRLISSTSGGLRIPGLYSLQNSYVLLPFSKELASQVGVNGIYASASLGYKNFLYLDLTARRDQSSTLPADNNSYYYPSISSSFIFSKFLQDKKWLSFGKVRLNYAMVGNSASFDQLVDNYNIITPYNSSITSIAGTKKNPELKPENTKSIEGGLEMYFFGRRVGFDLAIYKTNSIDQILPLAVSTSTGYTYKVINAGEIENKGIELSLMFTPLKSKNFKWEANVNWSVNKNTVVSLLEGVDNLQLGTFQGGITLNAQVGQPYGVLYGTNYTYDENGNKLVDSDNGMYIKTATSDQIIGNVNPDWTGGISNTFTYKNWAFSFLIDIQKGGDIFSLDMYYGMSTGLYKETSYINDLGNGVRDPLVFNAYDGDGYGIPSEGYASTSGGYINEGVNLDGSVNTTRYDASDYNGFGYAAMPDKAFVYDASYVKLREVAITYSLPASMLKKCFITGASLSIVASNPWIIFKNLPYADPESGLGAGNLQGYTTGSLPSTRNFGFNLKLNF